ncbi:MAG: hypothetical protein WAN31_10360 [Methylovirgula sp.]
MPLPSPKHRPYALAAAIFAAIALNAGDAFAGPFTALQGKWAGGGTISMRDGTRERIRCRASYSVASAGDSLTQVLLCASDSYKFDVNSTVTAQGGSISGNWTETTRNATGSVSGQVSGPVIEVLVTGIGFSAGISILTRGRAQAVAIRPQGGTDVVGVTVALHRV